MSDRQILFLGLAGVCMLLISIVYSCVHTDELIDKCAAHQGVLVKSAGFMDSYVCISKTVVFPNKL